VYEYEGLRRQVYAGGYTFVPVCETCGRFVKPDAVLFVNGADVPQTPNATCSKCGRVGMPYEGCYEELSGLTCVRADGCADDRTPDAELESGAAAAQLDR